MPGSVVLSSEEVTKSHLYFQVWSLEDSQRERALEIQRRRELVAAKKANALKALERAAERQKAIAAALANAQEQAASQPASMANPGPVPNPEAAQSAMSQPHIAVANGQQQSNGLAVQQEQAAIATAAVAANLDSGGDRRKRWAIIDWLHMSPCDATYANLCSAECRSKLKQPTALRQ